jgi:hypothetical protein
MDGTFWGHGSILPSTRLVLNVMTLSIAVVSAQATCIQTANPLPRRVTSGK